MFAIPFAINLGSVAVISRRCGILSCNQRAHDPPMFAIPTRMFAGRYSYAPQRRCQSAPARELGPLLAALEVGDPFGSIP
jgi:hypothetical protein